MAIIQYAGDTYVGNISTDGYPTGATDGSRYFTNDTLVKYIKVNDVWRLVSNITGFIAGTAGYIPKFSTPSGLTNSIMFESGQYIKIAGNLDVSGVFLDSIPPGVSSTNFLYSQTGVLFWNGNQVYPFTGTFAIPGVTGTVNYLAKFSSSTGIIASTMQESGSNLLVNGNVLGSSFQFVSGNIDYPVGSFALYNLSGTLKFNGFAVPVISTGTVNKIVKFASFSGLTNSIMTESGNAVLFSGRGILSGVQLDDNNTVPGVTTNLLYNNAGGLFWNTYQVSPFTGNSYSLSQLTGLVTGIISGELVYRETSNISVTGFTGFSLLGVPNGRTYLTGNNRLQVFINGVLQTIGQSNDYIEANNTGIKPTYALASGTTINFIIYN